MTPHGAARPATADAPPRRAAQAIRVGSDAGLPVAKAEAAATTTAAAAGGGAVRAVYRDMAVKLARKVGLM